LYPPIDIACTGTAFFHNPGAYDPDGDSLSYEFVTPFRDRNLTVQNYRDPNNQSFYQGMNYNAANEAATGPPVFSINPIDGTVFWDAPGVQGEYNIAFVIIEWRKVNGVWTKIGFVRRDMQIIVEDCNNSRPELLVPKDICVVAGTIINKKIFGIDPENNRVKIEAFSEIFDNTFPSPPQIFPDPASYQSSNPPAEFEFTWDTQCVHVKNQPYQIVLKITDDPPSGPRLVTFKTWRITIIGPPAIWSQAIIDLSKRQALLEWNPYVCQNAFEIQIWRRVADTSFSPDSCQTGIPEFLGYNLIDQVLPSHTSYIDTNGSKGLNVGAKYCYRLLVVFPDKSESYVSEEICIDPILADAPIITKVTVDATDVSDGKITVEWYPPFNADGIQFPPATYGYDYVVQRTDGFSATNFIAVHPGTLPGLNSFTDVSINTKDRIYSYRVIVYSQGQPFDTSSIASSVRLDIISQSDLMELRWNAVVPWSNKLQDFPEHEVFRGTEETPDSNFDLIGTVNVLHNGFKFVDTGEFNSMPLNTATVYCYRVKTIGGYGNDPPITEPLINYSQVFCARLNDKIPPCKPLIQISENDCDEYFTREGCRVNLFTNFVQWTLECDDDIRSFNVYAASSQDGNYILIKQNIQDTFYADENLASPARCYKVTAVDVSGNESDLSEPFCFDTCPYYELPNVFTPNSDGCNDVFQAWGFVDSTGEESGPVTICQQLDPESEDFRTRCAKFVVQVDFKVFNRWGKLVYSYKGQPGNENTIYINWNGRDNNGRDLASAVYYYIADVTFVAIDPDKKHQTYKGWVHLVR
jgi:hypothetical protein